MLAQSANEYDSLYRDSDVTVAGLRIPDENECAPIHRSSVAPGGQENHPAIWLLVAHGGAVLSTLAASWAPAADAQGGWPAGDVEPYTAVVTRTHLSGLARAHALLRQAAAGQIGRCQLVGLVTVADAPGRAPADIRHRLQVVRAAAPRTWHVPWIDQMRLAAPEFDRLPQWAPGSDIPQRRRGLDPL
ncbi:MAG: hypothetical protein L0H59_18360, partial [Tomitella sp.]|nr:hypothetical protein [Tomitella sp.]